MRFNAEKKKAIILYLMEKIDAGAENLTKSVAEAFDINQNTVHTYINQLVKENIIMRVRYGQYALKETVYTHKLRRSSGELESDMHAYTAFLKGYIRQLPDNVQAIWEYAFSEMINNVMDHSGAETATITVRQNYLKTTVCIQDDGIGIFEKIKNYFAFSSLEDAMCELFKGKLTTDAKNHSGEGIFFTSRIMDFFFILSGGKIFTHNKFEDGMSLNLRDEEQKGTYVEMSLSNYTQKQVREVFDMYSDVDGGFKKTVLPLKNFFDTSPVSRSQARRVCNRLNAFEEVILDFESLEWMGQGFAHQIFVVFSKEHPQVRIVPVHMNEAITKMYNHVLYQK